MVAEKLDDPLVPVGGEVELTRFGGHLSNTEKESR